MPADATCAVAIGFVMLLRIVVLDLAAVMMCLWAQWQGRETQLEMQHATHRLRFYCSARTALDRVPSAGRNGEIDGDITVH